MDYQVNDAVIETKDDFDFTKFRSNLRALTYANHLSYYKLGSETGILPSLFYRYENGTRTPDTKILIKLSNYFGVSINDLLGLNSYDEKIKKFVDLYIVLAKEDKERVDEILSKYGEI